MASEQTLPREAPTLTELIRALRTMPRLMDAHAERLTGALDAMHRFETTRRGDLQGLHGELTQMRAALEALVDKQEVLEHASRQQAVLSQEHFDIHVLEPVARALFELLDFADQFADCDASPMRSDSFRVFGSKISSVLSALGLRCLGVTRGDAFDPHLMRIVSKSRLCPDARAHLLVAAVSRRGFRRGDRILRPADVELFEFRSAEWTQTPASETQDDGDRS